MLAKIFPALRLIADVLEAIAFLFVSIDLVLVPMAVELDVIDARWVVKVCALTAIAFPLLEIAEPFAEIDAEFPAMVVTLFAMSDVLVAMAVPCVVMT